MQPGGRDPGVRAGDDPAASSQRAPEGSTGPSCHRFRPWPHPDIWPGYWEVHSNHLPPCLCSELRGPTRLLSPVWAAGRVWSLQGAGDVIGPSLRGARNSRGRRGNSRVVRSGRDASMGCTGPAESRPPPDLYPPALPSVGPPQSRLPLGLSPRCPQKVRVRARDPKDDTHSHSAVIPSCACLLHP